MVKTKDVGLVLKSIKSQLKNIGAFSDEQNTEFTKQSNEINRLSSICKQVAASYTQEYGEAIPNRDAMDRLVEVINLNIRLLFEKNSLQGQYISDIYNRVELIGKQVDRLAGVLLVEQKEKKR